MCMTGAATDAAVVVGVDAFAGAGVAAVVVVCAEWEALCGALGVVADFATEATGVCITSGIRSAAIFWRSWRPTDCFCGDDIIVTQDATG